MKHQINTVELHNVNALGLDLSDAISHQAKCQSLI